MAKPPRLLIFGPPLAGKGALLGAYAQAHDLHVERSTVPLGRERFPHWVARVESARPHVEVVTIPGAVWSIDAWWTFLSASAAVALVLDGQEARERADREHLDALMGMTLPAVRCVVFTKEDLIERGAVVRVSPSLSGDDRLANWQTFRTRNDKPTTLLEPIEWLIRQIAPSPTSLSST